jgi:hypothetical protein
MAGLLVVVLNLAAAAAYVIAARAFIRSRRREPPPGSVGDIDLSAVLRGQSHEMAIGATWAAVGTGLEGASLVSILLISLSP